MKCYDCGRELPMGANEITDGWTGANGDWFCPTCLRLASCEKAILDLQKMLLRAGVVGRTVAASHKHQPSKKKLRPQGRK